MPACATQEDIGRDLVSALQAHELFIQPEDIIVIDANIGRDRFPEVGSVKESSCSVLPKKSSDRQPEAAQSMKTEAGEATSCWELVTRFQNERNRLTGSEVSSFQTLSLPLLARHSLPLHDSLYRPRSRSSSQVFYLAPSRVESGSTSCPD
jgi:hypothetical protein